ncbi:MAG: hypothetical protein ACREIV_02220, partial [Planctomycetaceae bacterium]
MNIWRWSLVRARGLCFVLAAAVALQAVSCGLLLNPERVGAPHSHRLDPAIVVLDAAGLLLFFVPGVIAFVVDFATGTIWLPYDEIGHLSPADVEVRRLIRVQVDPDDLDQERIEQVVRRHVHRP